MSGGLPRGRAVLRWFGLRRACQGGWSPGEDPQQAESSCSNLARRTAFSFLGERRAAWLAWIRQALASSAPPAESRRQPGLSFLRLHTLPP